MPHQATRKNHSMIPKRLKEGAKVIAEGSMSAAVKEIKEKDGTRDIGISIDGTWQKRRFASLNDVVVEISTQRAWEG